MAFIRLCKTFNLFLTNQLRGKMRFNILAIYILLPATFNCGYAQELEPRALTNLPKEFNFVGLAYAYASGNTLLDPSLPLEYFNGRINTIILAYVRSVNFFGKSGKVDVLLPFAGGDFTGIFANTSFEDSYTGFGDLRIRASVNLTGAPSLSAKDFRVQAKNHYRIDASAKNTNREL